MRTDNSAKFGNETTASFAIHKILRINSCGVWKTEVVHTFFTGEDLDAVILFGRSLGYLDKTQQENSIRLLLRYIDGALERGRKRLEKNGRLYCGVSGLSGLLIVVTLL